MPEFEEVNSTIMAWADFYIAMRGVAPTLSDMTKARALYARVPHGKTPDITVLLARRYNRWHDYQELAAWMGDDETIGFYVPKGHQFEHMLAFFWMFAPPDAARLNNFEFEHIKHVKDAPKRTRGHEGTMLEELKAVVDRIDTVKTQLGRECGPPLRDHFAPDLPTGYICTPHCHGYIRINVCSGYNRTKAAIPAVHLPWLRACARTTRDGGPSVPFVGPPCIS